MNGQIDQINSFTGPGWHQKLPGTLAERPGSEVKNDIAKTSSKYILENNKIVFERYDRQGKLISRVPWTVKPISAKA
jgi:hypothetical protein